MTETEFIVKQIDIAWVKVVGRHRRDLGDIGPLAESIEKIGLIHPITVTEDGSLIAGQRRLEAFRQLGRNVIPARVAFNLDEAVERLTVERDENTARKPMTPEELVSLGKALEALEAPKAKERQGTRNDMAELPVQTNKKSSFGGTRDTVAEAIGMSPTSYYRARTVVEAAKNPTATPESREVAEAALAEMNATGKVTGPYETVTGLRPPGGSPRSKYSLDKARGQRRAVQNAVTTLSGIAHGLRQIEAIHPDITDVEAAQWVDGLSESRHAISMLIKRLKERTNAEV
jgi:ParB-like chromosome segregation protein Spo0J